MTNNLKLSAQRFKDTSQNAAADILKNSLNAIANAFESDRGRVLNSAAVRRLQQKTQVFPLEKNSAVRSRLTHSLEVMQVGRFIVQSICAAAAKSNNEFPTHLNNELTDIAKHLETLVEMACVLHDVGNPPFGHFGEYAISSWFKENANDFFKKHHNAPLSETEKTVFADLQHFEGNAQAIRLVHSLMNLNLTNSLVASVLKYTRCGTEAAPAESDTYSYLKKKVGYYLSEKAFVEQIQDSLIIKRHHRHPATYIMEAADDISYCMADLEDAVEKDIIDVPKLQQALLLEYAQISKSFNLIDKHEDSSLDIASFIEAHSDTQINYSDVPNALKMAYICHCAFQDYRAESIRKDSAFFIKFRVSIVHPLVNHATRRFLDNFNTVVDGGFNHALLEDKSHEHALSKSLKNVALKHVFSVKEVETAELQGYQILHGLLDKFGAMLSLNANDFMQVCEQGSRHFPLQTRLAKRIGAKHRDTYLQVVKKLKQTGVTAHTGHDDNQLSEDVMEYYYRCRLIQDHISGMTDQFALDEYQTLHAL